MESNNIKSVQELLQSGDFDQAVTVAKQVLENQPEDIYCLSVVAQYEFNQGHLDEAKEVLIKAYKINPDEVNINRNLGLLCNKQGDFENSVRYYLNILKSDQKQKGLLLDCLFMGISLCKISLPLGVKTIAWVFSKSVALKNAYQNQQELPIIREASNIANVLLRDYKYQQQKTAIEQIQLGFDQDLCKRINKFLDVFHGIQAPEYVHPMQKPTYHFFPGLDPHPFYDSEDFSWAKYLELNHQEIKDELLTLYNNKTSIRPYLDGIVTGNDGLDTLSNSLDWSSIHLIKAGEYQKEILNKCPKTNEIISKLPLPKLAGNGPEVFLSVLKAGAEIKPHHGLSNIKLTVHLGLDVPEDCALRSGPETRNWENGKVMIFDDSFEHEAWNRSNEDRFVLIMEIWHPDLTELERQGLQKIQELQHQFSLDVLDESLDSIIEKTSQLLD